MCDALRMPFELLLLRLREVGIETQLHLRGLWTEAAMLGSATITQRGMLELAAQGKVYTSKHEFMGLPVTVVPHPRLIGRVAECIRVSELQHAGGQLSVSLCCHPACPPDLPASCLLVLFPFDLGPAPDLAACLPGPVPDCLAA